MDVDLAIVGAGPCGLAAAVAARKAGLRAVVFDRGPIVDGITRYPTYMTFFSTADRIAIGGVPFIVATEKPSRRDALAYYRAVAGLFDLDVRQYETVDRIEAATSGSSDSASDSASASASAPANRRMPSWLLHTTRRSGGTSVMQARAIVVATGYFGRPNRLGVPGEELPHVRHGYEDGHYAWKQQVVIVGGGNSAVDAALDMYRAGGDVTMVHFAESLDANVKPWVRPDIEARLREGKIRALYQSRVTAIAEDHVVVQGPEGEQRVSATQVYELTGYLPETGLLQQVGVPIDPETGVPAHDPLTMATPVPGVYLAGVIASGFQANRIFIENGRDHGEMIVADLLSYQ